MPRRPTSCLYSSGSEKRRTSDLRHCASNPPKLLNDVAACTSLRGRMPSAADAFNDLTTKPSLSQRDRFDVSIAANQASVLIPYSSAASVDIQNLIILKLIPFAAVSA